LIKKERRIALLNFPAERAEPKARPAQVPPAGLTEAIEPSRQNVFHHVTMHVREPEVAALETVG
jgi:hypothetical protein